jgi:hypothetical protein
MVCVEFKLIHSDGGQGWAWSSMERLVDMEMEGEKAWGLLTMSWGCSNSSSHWRSFMEAILGHGPPWLWEIARGYSYEDIIADFQSLKKRRLDF